MSTKEIRINRSRKGIPCLWESYRQFHNDVKRTIVIFNKEGERKNPIFRRENSDKINLIPIEPSDVIAKYYIDQEGENFTFLTIEEISYNSNNATVRCSYREVSDEQNSLIQTQDFCLEMVDSMKSKLNDFYLNMNEVQINS